MEHDLFACLADGVTCVITRDGQVLFSSRERGIRPLLGLLREGIDVSGAIATDKIVGKAAALLYVVMKVGEVRAEVLSRAGRAVLEAHGIPCVCRTLTDHIINRRGDGLCPMEQTVQDIDDPTAAIVALEATVRRLAGK